MTPIVSGGGGGSGRQSATFDATTDPNTFLSPVHTFDLGVGAHTVLVTLTAVALVGDGETFGNAAGTIFATIAGVDTFPDILTNGDNGINYKSVGGVVDLSNYIAAAGNFVFEAQANGQIAMRGCIAGRYLRVQLGIFSNDTGALYTGANHPTAHCTIGVTY